MWAYGHEHPYRNQSLRSPREGGGGGYLRMHKQGGDESQLTKNGQLFQLEAVHISVPEYTEGG